MERKQQLLNIPISFYDESLKGLIIRACMFNANNIPIWLYELANLRANHRPVDVYAIDDSELKEISEILNMEVEKLSTLTFNNSLKDCEATIKITILNAGIRSVKTKICPKCLIESGFKAEN